jgi:NAD(P)-dependent dehydrogenase (short-subunit alcohol dehydrogenase family)
MKQALVTGANRGIGLELCRQLKGNGYQVWGVCREASPELKQIGIQLIESIDVTSEPDLRKMALTIDAQSLDLVINNAGILRMGDLQSFTTEDILAQYQVNSLAPLLVTRALLPKLKNPSKVAMITSRMGSIADNTSGSYYGYRASKAALNAIAKSLSIDLRDRGIAIGVLHPGFVQTDMTQHSGDRTPKDSATNLLQRIEDLNIENSGTFWHCDGPILPW